MFVPLSSLGMKFLTLYFEAALSLPVPQGNECSLSRLCLVRSLSQLKWYLVRLRHLQTLNERMNERTDFSPSAPKDSDCLSSLPLWHSFRPRSASPALLHGPRGHDHRAQKAPVTGTGAGRRWVSCTTATGRGARSRRKGNRWYH